MREQAQALVDAVNGMLDWYGNNEPGRLGRQGIQRVAFATHDLEMALKGEPLSDPGENDIGGFRADGHSTSTAAAIHIYPKSGTIRKAVLDEIVHSGSRGMTQGELEEALEGSAAPSSIRTRCSELVQGGWVMDSGRVRQTPAGLDSIVWVLTDKAQEELGASAASIS